MTADEINFQKGIWTIPARRNKAKRVHDVPLSKLALRIINQCIDEMEDGQRLIFSSERTDGEMSGWHKMKVRLDKASGCVHEIDRDEDGKPLLLWGEKWTSHDLRRTLGTNMAELGVDRDVRERLLNHSAETNPGDVHGTYNRFEYTKEKGGALELWAGKLTSILGLEPAENVVSLPTRAG